MRNSYAWPVALLSLALFTNRTNATEVAVSGFGSAGFTFTDTDDAELRRGLRLAQPHRSSGIHQGEGRWISRGFHGVDGLVANVQPDFDGLVNVFGLAVDIVF